MQNLNFDSNGNLEPYKKIATDLTTFEKTFVTDFPNSTTRKTLFDNYLRYLENFSKEMMPNFTQWINGSFVTLKENPKDLDFVTFIDVNLYDEKEMIMDNFLSFSLEDKGLDAYVLKIFPQNNAQYQEFTMFHLANWQKRFSFSKQNFNKQIFPKGFIKIEFAL